MRLTYLPAAEGPVIDIARTERPAVSAEPSRVAAVHAHQRIAFLDTAKGVGILLVVMGHCIGGLYAAGLLADDSAAVFAFYFIYTFHMPLFFLITGIFVEARVTTSRTQFMRTSLTRILYPYFLWGSISTAVLLLASGLTNQPLSMSADRALLQILWAPPAQFWFLYALFFLHAIALATLSLGGKVLFVGGFALLYAACIVSRQVSGLLAHYIAGTNILFYVLGVCLGGPLAGWRGTVVRPYLLLLIASLISIAAVWAGWSAGVTYYTYITLPAAFAGAGAILLLSYADPFGLSRWLEPLGRRSMPIYVLHIMFLAGARILLVRGFHVSNVGLILPVIFVVGVAGPLICEHIARKLRLNVIAGLA